MEFNYILPYESPLNCSHVSCCKYWSLYFAKRHISPTWPPNEIDRLPNFRKNDIFFLDVHMMQNLECKFSPPGMFASHTIPYLINSVTERPLFNFQSKIIKLNISVLDLCFGYWGVSVLCVSLWGLLQMGCLKPLFGQANSFCCSLTSCGFSIHIVWSMTQTDCAWNQNNIKK